VKLQPALTSGTLGVPLFGESIAKGLPRDTGEWIAVLGSRTAAAAQVLPNAQDELVDRIAFEAARADIEQGLAALVDAPLLAFEARARMILGASFGGIERRCEFEAESRQCLVRVTVHVSADSPANELYGRYRELIAAVTDARQSAGVDNLDIDISFV
jgi:hypothetical protein